MEPIGVVLWLHGGGWQARSTEDGAALADHGLLVVPGGYRLSAEAHWPAQLADVRAAARAARERADGLPLLVAGDAAGAHLALHLGLRGVDRRDDVDGVLAFWPPVDPLAEDWLRSRGGDDPWGRLLGHPPAAQDPATIDSSPLAHVGNHVPVLVVHGSQDTAVPVSQTVALTSALIRAGHPVHSLITHGGHGLDLRREDIRAVVRAFLGATLHRL
nr:alpha/beta hydrolase [Micromonospora sp. DSM 115978]